MIFSNKSPFRRLKYLHSICLFFALLLFTYGVLYYQSLQNYKTETKSRLNLSLDVLDGHFDTATLAIANVLNLITGDCATDEKILSSTLVEVPSVQSINVLKKGVITCSTYKPIIGSISSSNTFVNFTTSTSKIIVPGKTIVIIKSGNDELSISASLHGFLLFGVIKILDIETPFHINTPAGWINDEQQLVTTKNHDTLYLASQHFPYSISTKYDYQKIFFYFLESNAWSLLLL